MYAIRSYYGLLFAGDVLGASPVLRAEADDEVEEDRLAQQEPESDEDTDQQDDEVDVLRVGGELCDVSIDHLSPLEA